ncbi:MAG: prepilin-type N-terminal cleavage/methylation domain-containing protein [Pseudoruegeria sp.]
MPKPVSKDRGITLVELAVAILILSIGLVATLRTVDQSRRGIGQEAPRFLARNVALNRAEALRFYGLTASESLPQSMIMGQTLWTITQTEEATIGGFYKVTIQVSAPGQPGAVLVAYANNGPLG